MYRIESSGPFSDPVAKELVRWGLPERGISRVCGHPCHYCWDGGYGVPGGFVRGRFEICPDCVVVRSLSIAEGDGAEQFLELCERLQLRPFNYDPDDFTVHEFWLVYVSGGGGRNAAIAEALSHGYRLPGLN